MLRLLALFMGILLVAITFQNDGRIVQIHEGKIKGTNMMSFHGREFRAFRGIPYAEPPTGPRRFKPPQPKSPWEGVLNVITEGPVCPQMVVSTKRYAGDEDCLYLNVYTHKNAVQNPVIVWMHGGGFIEGHGGVELTGPKYLMDHDVVLVTFNYRLGPLGFLSTGDPALPGNYGLKDAVEVLRWVQRNIRAFGGDRDLVTVFGYSSGAACVHSLTMSPLTKGLFHRVVFESGSALHYWAFKSSPMEVACKVAELIGCPSSESSRNITECLSRSPVEELVQTLYNFPSWAVNYPLPYGIVIEIQDDDSDPPFLTDHPWRLIRKGLVHKVPAITGVTAAESIILSYLITHSEKLSTEFDNNFGKIALGPFFPYNISEEIIGKVKNFYFGGISARGASFQQLLSFFSDTRFNYNTFRSVLAHARATDLPVYVYVFAFQGRLSNVMDMFHTAPLGVNHADDLYFVFERNKEFPDGGPNEEETKTIMRVTKMLTDFALTGDPTPETSDVITTKWLPVDGVGGHFRYLEINNELKMHDGPFFHKRIAFWDSLFVRKSKDEL